MKISNTEFEQVFEIMEKSFPEEEFRTKQSQYELLYLDYYNIKCVKNDENEVVGFISFFEFDRFVHIDHFAISPSMRNSGIGSKMLADFMKNTNKLIILEVEPPIDEISKRRINFYKRHGFVFCNFDYIHPPIRPNTEAVPLKIMSTQILSEGNFDFIKEVLFEKVYFDS